MPDFERLAGRVDDLASALLRVGERTRRYRTPLIGVSLLIFVAGLVWSAAALELNLETLKLWPVLLLFFVVTPLGLLYSAVGLMLLAKAASQRMPLRDAWNYAGVAQLADSLPLPGGVIVRSAALLRTGANMISSAALVSGTGLLWAGLATTGAAYALLVPAPIAAAIMASVGLLVSSAVLLWIASRAGVGIAMLILAHRLVGLLHMALRLWLAFAVLGTSINISSAFYYIFANVAASAVGFAPAGLGIGESIAAAMSIVIKVEPAVAFLAVAINRLIVLSSCAATVGLNLLFSKLERSPSRS